MDAELRVHDAAVPRGGDASPVETQVDFRESHGCDRDRAVGLVLQPELLHRSRAELGVRHAAAGWSRR